MPIVNVPERRQNPDSWSNSASIAVVSAFNHFFSRPARRPAYHILDASQGRAVAGSPEPIEEPPSPIRRLTPDILVDEIFQYLLIDELLRLRKTCKAFYLITHETVIWKRYFRRLKIPISLLRPTFEYDKRISNYEIETLVTSACAIDRAWRGGFPRIHQERVLTSQCKVVDLCLLPGGKFLVASIKDRSNYRFFILVYALDVSDGSRMIARIPTLYKAFDLQAKYMMANGKPGIMIYYTRRRFERGVPTNRRDNINEFHHRVRYPTEYTMIYEAICVHMRLDSVEKLIYPQFQRDDTTNKRIPINYPNRVGKLPPPFVDVICQQSRCEIHSPSLTMVNNDPVLFYAEDTHRGSEVVYRNLHFSYEDGSCRIICEPAEGFEGLPHRIRAMRFIPCQKCILVIRSVRVRPDSTDTILVEIYDLPRKAGDHKAKPYRSWSFEDKWDISNEVVISDDAHFTAYTSYHPDLVNHRYQPPPTIWVFAPSAQPRGCVYFYIRPKMDEYARWRYSEFVEPRVHRNVRGHYERTLPGSLRSLILEVDNLYSPAKLNKMRRFYFSQNRFPDVNLANNEDGEGSGSQHNELMSPMAECPPDADRALTDIICSEDVGHAVNNAGGMAAAAWDELSGKICVAAENDDFIRFLDVAPVVEPHKRLAFQWNRQLVEPDSDRPSYVPLLWPEPRRGRVRGANASGSNDVEMGGPSAPSQNANALGDSWYAWSDHITSMRLTVA